MIETANYLKKNGIRPSEQRVRIYEYLSSRKNHPTADMIYSALAPKMPTLSKATVYNTLKRFISQGVAMPVMIEENEIRYDADTHLHGHFKCDICGKIFDFSSEFPKLQTSEMKNFLITEQHIYLKGICKFCRKKEEDSKN